MEVAVWLRPRCPARYGVSNPPAGADIAAPAWPAAGIPVEDGFAVGSGFVRGRPPGAGLHPGRFGSGLDPRRTIAVDPLFGLDGCGHRDDQSGHPSRVPGPGPRSVRQALGPVVVIKGQPGRHRPTGGLVA